jgi:hypothetical protein
MLDLQVSTAAHVSGLKRVLDVRAVAPEEQYRGNADGDSEQRRQRPAAVS